MAGIVINTGGNETTASKSGLEGVIGFLNKDIKIFGNQLKDKKSKTFTPICTYCYRRV